MKHYYQIIYNDEESKGAGSQEIFSDIIDAWLHVMDDCENDRDIAHLMERISSGEIQIKTLQAKEL